MVYSHTDMNDMNVAAAPSQIASGLVPCKNHPAHARHATLRTALALGLAGSMMLCTLGACGTASNPTVTANVSSSAPSSSASSSSSSASSSDASSSPASTEKPSASSQTCRTSELSAKLTQGDGGGAGSSYPYLILTNSGSRTCTIKGYPGVSLRHGSTQIGAAAQRENTVASAAITLKPGESAHSKLRIVNAGNFDSADCSPTQADSMLVYPPDQTDSISVETNDFTGCGNADTQILYVQALEAGQE